jgi:hypothetical protein
MNAPTTARLSAAVASFVISLVLFQGVASLARDEQPAAPEQVATATATASHS